MKKLAVFLFNASPSGRVFIRSNASESSRADSKPCGRSFLDMLVSLAEMVLPSSEWTIQTFGCDKALKQWIQDTPPKFIDLAIADIYFDSDKSYMRHLTDTSRATDVLLLIKKKYGKRTRCILTSTLPEPCPESSNSTSVRHSRGQPQLDSFIPLSHTNTSPWDEVFNVLKREDSLLTFDTSESGHLSDKDFFFDGEANDFGGLIKMNVPINAIDWTDNEFRGRVIVKNCTLKHLRIRRCTFLGPVLFYNCKFLNVSCVDECKMSSHLNFVNCEFCSDLYFERSDLAFVPLLRTGEQAENRCRLPWFNSVVFKGQFVFRNNSGISPTKHRPHTLMFSYCEFLGRIDLMLPKEQTKLAVYASGFHSGQHIDICYPYFTEEMQRARVSYSQGYETDIDLKNGRFVIGGPYREIVEVRLCLCNIAGRIVVREHPWPLDPILAELSHGELAQEPDAKLLPISYDAQNGLGINLHGSTISGSINLRYLRVKWINCERMTVLGGALFMNAAAFRKPNFTGRWWSASNMQVAFDVTPEVSNIVFEEQYGLRHEEARFATHFQRSQRLIEHSLATLSRVEMLRSIAQQYEDLRKAFKNASNSHAHEDFCQYKTMMWLGEAMRITNTHKSARVKVIWAGFKLVLGVITAVIALSLVWLVDLSTSLTAFVYSLLFSSVVYLSVSRSARQYFRGLLDWYLYRKMFGYLIYPSRIIASALLMILFFAIFYSIVDVLSQLCGEPQLGGIVNSSSTVKETRYMNGKFLRMLHFSAVTFTTLGYGDEVPVGVMRPLSNLEALIGALFISMITVASARQVIRS